MKYEFFAWHLLSLIACAPTNDDSVLCQEANDAMLLCFGEPLSESGCRGYADRDLVSLRDNLQALSCETVGAALPIDGDYRASTCRLSGLGCVGSINPSVAYQPTRYPVVLVNGIDVSPLFRYAPRILDVMRSLGGHEVFLAIDTPYESPKRRARDLWARIQEVRAETGADKVNLICHSLGGLDCRYLVSPAGLHWEIEASHEEILGAVASITTVSTAHRGTRVVDLALGYAPDADDFDAANRLATLLGETYSGLDIEGDVHLRESLQALSTSEAIAFNAEINDAEGLFYQSWAGFSRPYGVAPAGHDEQLFELCRADDESSGLDLFVGWQDYMATPLIPSAQIVDVDPAAPGIVMPNDGLVAIPSAKWGFFRGCIPADHMEQLGQRDIPDVNVRTGFDVARFYANVAGDLSERGL